MRGKGSIHNADILNNIGIVHYSQENFSEALKYYKKSLEIIESGRKGIN